MKEIQFLKDFLYNSVEYKTINKSDKNYEYYIKNKKELENNNIKPYSITEIINIINQSKNKDMILDALNDFDISKLYKSYIHGLNHNIRVLLYSFILSEVEKLNEIDIQIIFDAAKYHDIGRINDSKDDEHGRRSSESLSFLKSKYSSEEFNLLKTIIECHSLNESELINIAKKNNIKDFDRCEKLLNILKDSDGLDRVRLEYPYIKVEFIRTETAKKMILASYEIYESYNDYIKNKKTKKIKTSSHFTWVIQTKKYRYVRQYKRSNKDIHGYPRTVPTHKIMKLVNNSKIYTPKLLRNRLKYIDQEFISGYQLDCNFDREKIIETIIDYIVEMNNINHININRYINWNNNNEYLKFLVKHLYRVKESFSEETKDLLIRLNINDLLDNFINVELDNSRKLTLIHGDIHIGNMINKNNNIYLLDWELATCGDLAYELATHFILMKYSSEEKEYFIDKLCNKLNLDKKMLSKDISIYILYEMIRRVYLRINKVNKLLNRGKEVDKELEDLYEHYNDLTNLLNLNSLSFEELKNVVEVSYE